MSTVVDVHAHLIVGEVERAVAGAPGLAAHRALDARRNGAESGAVSGRMVAERFARLTDLDTRLTDMDAAGIGVQLVSPSPSQYHYWADERLAETVWRTANEGTATFCAKAPDRLRGLGLVPLQFPGLAVAALDHAVRDCGLAGVEISSHAPGPGGAGTVELSDPALEPFWSRAEELGTIVFVHPFGCTLDERLDRWYLSNIVGQPVENAVALSHLIFSGVLDRHPGLRLVVAHGGGYLPTFLGRADHGWAVRPDARQCASKPSDYLRRLWFDSLVHTPQALHALVEAAGADRVLLGSDYPFDMGVEDPVARLDEAGLPADHRDAIAFGNAARLGLTSAPTEEQRS
ncbi:aminocarboxymuconate-semialdehyde decarboxylase [Catenuloplanes nepalensis]|uniref:Aminocarboxymuconate-semialdehyde decarboxylase n=1 Tax=Catenuloplanes nepalensis TaxID=587533 RepID=A0ABT9MNM7_9ACTN|nr:amidohydrolase family protein [Catenuloplanes nepalensis]MDP9793003.1 aminocarboxymuconate-semialdehyde decarboxylase [Catenuloplanes nepalensis]